ncbi:hypothetical protein PILCRDRAFT_8737 [Piloderma croceum F 1598]|uniref:Uncharacterized protein n=1 Tax=Piloderma croceum (strain F 1598) TaxID=765440 RepID=A0A0C3FNN8_PILCF|nr:hypothetical protein PILCRDRAFT_8737 [Piloderma croceum F 1598]
MSSEAEQLAAKLAEIMDARKKKEEHCRLMELEAEQEQLKEERLQGELERMRAKEQRKREVAKAAAAAEEAAKMEFTKKQAEEMVKRKKEVESKKRAEEDKGKKRGREESVELTIGDVVEECGVVWYVQEGWVCEACEKAGEKCLWTDAPRATMCRHCHTNKKPCLIAGSGQDGAEAGLSKRKKVGSTKGKGKEKEGSEEEVGGVWDEVGGMREAVTGLLTEIHALGDVGRALVKLLKSSNSYVGYIADYMQRMENEQRSEGVDMEGVEVGGMGGNVGVGDNVGGDGSEQEVDGTLQ